MQVQTTPDPIRWRALMLLCAAQFIVILDTSIIGIALPAIQQALGFSSAGLQWVFNAYVIAFGALLLLGGRLADLKGARFIFMSGFLVLGAGSVLAGGAWSAASLVAGRAIQGLGAAMIAPAGLTLVMGLFQDPRERARALGFWGASAAAGGSAGVFLGGVISHWLDWRWAFFINVPLVVLVLCTSPVLLRRSQASRGSIDFAGTILATMALVLSVYAIVGGKSAGTTAVLLAVAVGLFSAFILLQKRRHTPLVPLRIFKATNVSAGNVVMGLLGAAWIPGWFFLNLYLQQGLGQSPLQSGVALLPMTIAIMVLMMGVTGAAINRFGFKRNLVVGLILLATALLWLGQAPAEGAFMIHVLPASLLAALGMSLAYIPATIAGVSGARPEESGVASGLINTSYQIGSALGLACMAAISAARSGGWTSAGVGATLSRQAGFQAAFWGAAVVALMAAFVAAVAVRVSNPATPSAKLSG